MLTQTTVALLAGLMIAPLADKVKSPEIEGLKLDERSIQQLIVIQDKHDVANAGQQLLAFSIWVHLIHELPKNRKALAPVEEKIIKTIVEKTVVTMTHSDWNQYDETVSAMKGLKKLELVAVAKDCRGQYVYYSTPGPHYHPKIAQFWKAMMLRYDHLAEQF